MRQRESKDDVDPMSGPGPSAEQDRRERTPAVGLQPTDLSWAQGGRGTGSAAGTLRAQRTLGNQAVQRLLDHPVSLAHPDQAGAGHTATDTPIDPSQRVTASGQGTLQRIEWEVREWNGQALDSRVREQMEDRVGRPLDGVRIHTDAQASLLAGELGAAAFTLGSDVFFASGRYAPGTPGGDRTLAHEITHVAQQRGPQRAPHAVADHHTPAEIEAHRIADGGRGAQEVAPPGVIHRQPASTPEQPAPAAPAPQDKKPQADADGYTLHDFAVNQAWPPRNMEELPKIAEAIRAALTKNPGAIVSLIGHTDETGDDAYNMRLGAQRADAVKRWLTTEGKLPASALETASVGRSQPLPDTGPKSGANRRVQVHIPVGLGSTQPAPGTPLGSPGKKPDQNALPEKPEKPDPLRDTSIRDQAAMGKLDKPKQSQALAPTREALDPQDAEIETKLRRIKQLDAAITGTPNPITKDELLREVRNLLAKIPVPTLSEAERKKLLDGAIVAGSEAARDAAIDNALKKLVPNRNTMPSNPTHTMGDMAQKDLKEKTVGIAIPFDSLRKPSRVTFQFVNLKDSYRPGAEVNFILYTPDKFDPVIDRTVVAMLLESDYRQNGPFLGNAVASEVISSKGEVHVSLPSPEKEGTYILAVRQGPKWREASEAFKVAK